ncbi:MAG TPA: sigma-54 dependent transcriptional regulator [Candidatus Acidoferrales bacterium]|nr:sigma-54 dependent transcriptional regulator [Candidatus Acidoferrales bacterium]
MQELTPTVLLVDDEPDILTLLELTLERMGLACHKAATLADARSLLARNRYVLCLTDMRLPDGNGIDLVREIATLGTHLPVAVITAHGNVESAVEALKAGAYDFVSKPVDLGILRTLVTAAVKSSTSPRPDRRTRHILLGDSEPMRRLRGMISKVSNSQAPIYISGESGTGKELVARLIHAQSNRNEGPFVPVNCGALPAELMESELFGHRKGSFTGAVSDNPGMFRTANGGTLFLDEVAELPLPMQVKLLRAIQERAVRPVGESREVAVDVRLLSATHKPLEQMLQTGAFRQDLYYRINVIELRVPPLRERREDLPQLTEHILRQIAGEAPPRLDEGAWRALRAYPFPGNVRELENILQRAYTLCDGRVIAAEHLQLTPPIPVTARTELAPAEPADEPDRPLTAAPVDLDGALENIERETILRALEAHRWNRTATARSLGITFRALRYRLKKLGLE